ncbi:MAG TPA: phytoene/squalene synthase family protein [Candidatus Dormibacteraeota bacterium]|jgi:phytoene synthase|nr:phytoene/squalene synthase family protein [Candidatus Dormibacteraeota bacterium]
MSVEIEYPQAAPVGRMVAGGRRECARIARGSARTFYIAFCLLPARRRHAIHAVYAFSRAADDVADDPALPAAEKLRRLGELREGLARVYAGTPRTPQQAALTAAAAEFAIPRALLETLVDGVAMDVSPRRHADLAALHEYCHAVAGVVGQMCVRVFGSATAEADALAGELGFALQLTNILRDLAEDAADGRFYLPLDELAAHGLDEAAVLAAVPGDGPAARFLQAQAERAAAAFAAADRLLPLVPRGSRPCLAGIALLYRTLLERLRERDCAPEPVRLRLSPRTKLAVAGRAVVAGVVRGRL